MAHMIERDFWIDPGVVFFPTLVLVVHNLDRKSIPGFVDTFVKFAAKKLNPHNWKDEPEDKTDEKDVENGRNGVHQSVNYNLEIKIKFYQQLQTR